MWTRQDRLASTNPGLPWLSSCELEWVTEGSPRNRGRPLLMVAQQVIDGSIDTAVIGTRAR
jgi:hypothetical protein